LLYLILAFFYKSFHFHLNGNEGILGMILATESHISRFKKRQSQEEHMHSRILTLALLFAAGTVASQVAFAQNPSACQSGNAATIGTYGFVLNPGAFFPGLPANPPGTNTTTAYSTTAVGSLLAALSPSGSPSASGEVYLDGSGSVFASATIGGSFNTFVGTYAISPDCTIAVSLTDVFSTAAPRPKAVAFTGLIANSGAEIDLALGSELSTISTQGPERTLLRLLRVPNAPVCSVSTLSGPYALVATGFQSSSAQANPSGAARSFVFLARVLLDGTGKVIVDPAATAALAQFQYTGTYTVNSDCTGSLKISQSKTGPTYTASILIVNPIVQVNPNGSVAFQNAYQLRPGFVFSFVTADTAVSGLATAE
jgi:hypothetical protein